MYLAGAEDVPAFFLPLPAFFMTDPNVISGVSECFLQTLPICIIIAWSSAIIIFWKFSLFTSINKERNNFMCECKDEKINALDAVLDQYERDAGSLIGILQKTQDIFGYLPADIIYYVAAQTCTTPAKVMGVATFYTQFRLEPVGKYLIMLCKGTACHVNGSDRIEAAITNELGIINGQTTSDGLFTLKNVACLGCCSLSPVMMINDETFGSLTPEKAVSILNDFRNRKEA